MIHQKVHGPQNGFLANFYSIAIHHFLLGRNTNWLKAQARANKCIIKRPSIIFLLQKSLSCLNRKFPLKKNITEDILEIDQQNNRLVRRNIEQSVAIFISFEDILILSKFDKLLIIRRQIKTSILGRKICASNLNEAIKL